MRNQRSVNLHIERLILNGALTDGTQSAAVQSAVEQELARLLRRETPDLGNSGVVPRLAVPEIRLARGINPSQLGSSIGGALYAGLGSTGKNK